MNYYDFYGGVKQVISQNENYRLLLVKYKKDLILIDEYYDCIDNMWQERKRLAITKEQINRLSGMV